MGTDRRDHMVRLGSFHYFGVPRHSSSFEDGAHLSAGDLLQSAVADAGSVPALVGGNPGGFTRRRHNLSIPVGSVTDGGRALVVCFRGLPLQAEEDLCCVTIRSWIPDVASKTRA